MSPPGSEVQRFVSPAESTFPKDGIGKGGAALVDGVTPGPGEAVFRTEL